jgi:threonylcarbamoyladenosine tRNA methylthiotransferase CDKAL1
MAGMTRFFINTYGCSANVADSERMAGLLQKADFKLVEDIKDADVVIFNTCTVKGPSESAFFKNLEYFKRDYPYKLVVVAGCIPQADPQKLKQYSIVGTQSIHRIVEVVEESLNDNVLQILGNDEIPPLDMPKVRKNPVVEIIPINRGCLGACTFCKTKKARGNLISYSIEEIVEVAKKALIEGVKEIWLTSQDTFCYGFDIGSNINELLKPLVALSGDFKIRIGMGNPDHLPKIQDELIELYKHPKIFKFLHLPLQAGHNNTLKEMKRRYTVQQFRDAVDAFRKAIPEINLMTDIIVGYPTETEEHFWGTLQAVRRLNPDSINISRFWPRPGTPAAELKQLQGEEVKRRSMVLTDIFHNISALQNERWKEWEGSILIDEKGKGEGQWIGRNYAYKQIIVEGDYKLGEKLDVKIVRAERFCLKGILLNRVKVVN